jgi:hypothetical protein
MIEHHSGVVVNQLSDLFGLVIVVIVVVGIASALLQPLGAAPKLRAKLFMTEAETAFYRRLRVAAAPLNVAPQVAMAAIVTTAGGGNDKRRGARNTFDRKIIDFVLFDDDGNVKLLVELDDRTHRTDKDAARDKLTASAGYRTLRMRGSDARDADKIRNSIAAALEPIVVPSSRWQKR